MGSQGLIHKTTYCLYLDVYRHLLPSDYLPVVYGILYMSSDLLVLNTGAHDLQQP